MKGKLKDHLSQFLPICFDLCSIGIKKLTVEHCHGLGLEMM
jgi:hypothetical protein